MMRTATALTLALASATGVLAGTPAAAQAVAPITSATMLQRSDMPNWTYLGAGPRNGDYTLESIAGLCRGGAGAVPRSAALRKRQFGRGTGLAARYAIQHVERFRSRTVAARAVAAHETWVRNCRPLVGGLTIRVIRTGFAGPDSLLVRSHTRYQTNLWTLVRRGDLTSQVAQVKQTDTGEARRIAVRAARRLCAGTTAC